MPDSMLLINVLPKDSYDDCRIPGSVSVPLEKLPEFAQNLVDKNQKIVVYCASFSCPLSRKAWHLMHDLSFKNVWAFEGGMAEWKQHGLATEGDCKAPYLEGDHQRPESDGRVREMSLANLKNLL